MVIDRTMKSSFVKLQHVASFLFLVSFAFNILCPTNQSIDVTTSNKSHYTRSRWPNQSLREASKKPRFKCNLTEQCFFIWVLEPACSSGYLQSPKHRPGYIRVSIKGSNLCSNNSLSLSLSWLWRSNKTKSGREIKRCSKVWTCMVPLKATLTSGQAQRWLDIVVFTSESSNEVSKIQNLPVTISLRSKSLEKKNELQKSTINMGGVGDTDKKNLKRGNMFSPSWTFYELIHRAVNLAGPAWSNGSQTFSFLVKPDAPSHQKLKNNFTYERTFGLERLINLLSKYSSFKSPIKNNSMKHITILKNYNISEKQNKQKHVKSNHRSSGYLIKKHRFRTFPTRTHSYTYRFGTKQSAVNMEAPSGHKTILQTLLLHSHRKTNITNKSNQIAYSSPIFMISHWNKKTNQTSLATNKVLPNNQTEILRKLVLSPRKTYEVNGKRKVFSWDRTIQRNPAHFAYNKTKVWNAALQTLHTDSYLYPSWVQNDNFSQADEKSIPVWLRSSKKLRRNQLRPRRSIRQVEEDEAADLAILMNGESKEDRNKIAAMIASDFESTADLSEPVVSRKHWRGGSSRVGRANDNKIKEMDHLIDVLEDEEAKVTSNLPLGDGDQEDLLVEVGSKAHLAKLRHQIRTKKRKLDHAKKALTKANLLAVASDMQEVGGAVPGEIIVEKNELKSTVSDLESSLQRLRDTYSDLINENRHPENEFNKLNGVVTIDPVWSYWSAWSSCGSDCTKGGYSTRRRSCDTLPSVPCPGSNFDMKQCNFIRCEGQWVTWGNWGPCSATCGKGIRARSRVCQGKGPCKGPPSHSVVCDQIPCSTYDDAGNVLLPPESEAARAHPQHVHVKTKKTSSSKQKSKSHSTSSGPKHKKAATTRNVAKSRHTTRARSRARGRRGIPIARHKLSHAGPLVVPKKFRDSQGDGTAVAAAALAASLEDEDDILSDEEDEAEAVAAQVAAAAAAGATGGAAVGAAKSSEKSAHGAEAEAKAQEKAEEEVDEEEETELSGETIIFIVLLIILLALLIIAFCIWFTSRYQDAKLRQELSEAIPFYSSQEYDDFDTGGDQFDNMSRGVVKPIIRNTNDTWSQQTQLKKTKGKGRGDRIESEDDTNEEEKKGFFGRFWKKKKGDKFAGYAFGQTEFPEKAMQQLYWKGKLKDWPMESKSDLSGAGDATGSVSDSIAGSHLDGSRVNLNDKLRRLDFEHLTQTVNRPIGRSKSRRKKEYKIRGSTAKTNMAPVAEVSSTETDKSRIVRKSRSFPDLHNPQNKYSNLDKRKSSSEGISPNGADALVKGSASSVRPSASDNLMHRTGSVQTRQHYRRHKAKQRFPYRYRQRRRGKYNVRGPPFNVSIQPTDQRIETEPAWPSEGHVHILADPEKEQLKVQDSVISTLIPESSSIQRESNSGTKPDRQKEVESLSTSDKADTPGKEKETEKESKEYDAEWKQDTRRRANRKHRWWRKTNLSSSASSQPLSSKISPLVSPTSSTWLTSLLSETDLKLGNIDREMDTILSQVCSYSHTDQTDWSSESLGFVGGGTSSTSTEFTELRSVLPKNSEAIEISECMAYSDSDESERKEYLMRGKYEESDSVQLGTTASTDSHLREENRESSITETSVSPNSTGHSGSNKEVRGSSGDSGSERNQDTQLHSGHTQSIENSGAGISNFGKNMEYSDLGNQASGQGTGGDYVSQQTGSLNYESSHLKSNDKGTSEVSQETSCAQQTGAAAFKPHLNESSVYKSSEVMSELAKSKVNMGVEKEQEHISTTDQDLSSQSVDKKYIPQQLRNQANVRKAKEKESQTLNQENTHSEPRKEISGAHAQDKFPRSPELNSCCEESPLIKDLDSEVQTIPLVLRNRLLSFDIKDEGEESLGSAKVTPRDNILLSSESESSPLELEDQRSLDEKKTNLDSTHKTTETSNPWEDLATESSKTKTYEDKKSQVLRMFEPKYFTFPLFQPPTNSSFSLLHSLPRKMLSPVPAQGQAISVTSELSTTNNYSSQSWPSNVAKSSEIMEGQPNAEVKRTRKHSIGEAKPPPGVHRGMGRSVAAWQFMTPGLGNYYRGCTYRSTSSYNGAEVAGSGSFPYRAGDMLFQDSLTNLDFAQGDTDKTISVTQNTTMPEHSYSLRDNDIKEVQYVSNSLKNRPAPSKNNEKADLTQVLDSQQKLSSYAASDQISEGLPQGVFSMPISSSSTFKDTHGMILDRSKSFPAQTSVKSIAREKCFSEQTDKIAVSDSAASSSLDQLWQLERSKELSKSSKTKSGSLGIQQGGKLAKTGLSTTAEDINSTGKNEQEVSGSFHKQNLKIKGSRSAHYAPNTFTSLTSSRALQHSRSGFRGNSISADPKTYPFNRNEEINVFRKDKSDKLKQPDTSSKQFLATLNKELDTFVDTAAWSSSKSPSQIRIDWDKCGDVRKRRQQENLRKVVISGNYATSQTLQQSIEGVSNIGTTELGIKHAPCNDLDKRTDSNKDSLPPPCGLTCSQTGFEIQSLKSQQDRPFVTLETAERCPINKKFTLQYPKERYCQVQCDDKVIQRNVKSQSLSVPHQSHCFRSDSQSLKVGFHTALQNSPNKHVATTSVASSSKDRSPDVSESPYSTGNEDIVSLDSWVSAQTYKSQRHKKSQLVPSYVNSNETHMFTYGHPPKLPPSVEVLSPAEVKLLTTAEGLRSIKSRTAGEKIDPSTSGQHTAAVSLTSYKTSGKPFSCFPLTNQPYVAARDTIMSANQLTKFRTGRRPNTQFRTPGIELIPSESKLSSSETSCSSFSGSDFISAPSQSEASLQDSWTSVKMLPDEISGSYASSDKESNTDKISVGTEYRSEEGKEPNSYICKASYSGASTRFLSDHGTDKLSESGRRSKSSQEIQNDSRPESMAGHQIEISSDYGSEKGTNYRSDWGTEFESDFGSDIRPEKSIDHVSENRYSPDYSSQLRTARKDFLLPEYGVVPSVENQYSGSVEDMDLHTENLANKESSKSSKYEAENVENESAVKIQPESRAESIKSESNEKDLLKILSSLSSEHNSLSLRSTNNPNLVSKQECETTKVTTMALDSSESRKSLLESSTSTETAHPKESKISISKQVSGSSSHNNDLNKQCQSVPAGASSPASHDTSAPPSVTLSCKDGPPQSQEQKGASAPLVFSRSSSPVEATSATSEWNTYPTTQRMDMERETENHGYMSNQLMKPPVTKCVVAKSAPDEVLFTGESSGGVSSLSVPTWSDLAYTISIFPKSSDLSLHTDGNRQNVKDTQGAALSQPDTDNYANMENVEINSSHTVGHEKKSPKLSRESPVTAIALPVESMKSRSFIEFCDRLDQIISAPPEEDSPQDGVFIPELSSHFLLKLPEVFQKTEQYLPENYIQVHEENKLASSHLKRQSNIDMHTLGHTWKEISDNYPSLVHQQDKQFIQSSVPSSHISSLQPKSISQNPFQPASEININQDEMQKSSPQMCVTAEDPSHTSFIQALDISRQDHVMTADSSADLVVKLNDITQNFSVHTMEVSNQCLSPSLSNDTVPTSRSSRSASLSSEPNKLSAGDLIQESFQAICLSDTQVREHNQVNNAHLDSKSPTQQVQTTFLTKDHSKSNDNQHLIGSEISLEMQTNTAESKISSLVAACSKVCEMALDSDKVSHVTQNSDDEVNRISKCSGPDVDYSVQKGKECELQEGENLIDLESLADLEELVLNPKQTAENIQPNPQFASVLSSNHEPQLNVLNSLETETCRSKEQSVAVTSPCTLEEQNLNFNVASDPRSDRAKSNVVQPVDSNLWKSLKENSKTGRFGEAFGNQNDAVKTLSKSPSSHKVYCTKHAEEMTRKEKLKFSIVSLNSCTLKSSADDQIGLVGSCFESPICSVDQRFLDVSPTVDNNSKTVSPMTILDSSFDFSLTSLVMLDSELIEENKESGHDRNKLVVYSKVRDIPDRSLKSMKNHDLIDSECMALKQSARHNSRLSAFVSVKSSKSCLSDLSSSHADCEYSTGDSENADSPKSCNAELILHKKMDRCVNSIPRSRVFKDSSDNMSDNSSPASIRMTSLHDDARLKTSHPLHSIEPSGKISRSSHSGLAASSSPYKYEFKLKVCKNQIQNEGEVILTTSTPGSVSSSSGHNHNQNDPACSGFPASWVPDQNSLPTESRSPDGSCSSGNLQLTDSSGIIRAENYQLSNSSNISKEGNQVQSPFISHCCNIISAYEDPSTHSPDNPPSSNCQRRYYDLDTTPSKYQDSYMCSGSHVHTYRTTNTGLYEESSVSAICSSLEVLHSAANQSLQNSDEFMDAKQSDNVEYFSTNSLGRSLASNSISPTEYCDWEGHFRHSHYHCNDSYPSGFIPQHSQEGFSKSRSALKINYDDKLRAAVPPRSHNSVLDLRPKTCKNYLPQDGDSLPLQHQPALNARRNVSTTAKSSLPLQGVGHGQSQVKNKNMTFRTHQRSKSFSKKEI